MSHRKPIKLTFATMLLFGLSSCGEMQSTAPVGNPAVRSPLPSDKDALAAVQGVDSPGDYLNDCDEAFLDQSFKEARFLVAQCQTRNGYELRFVRIVGDQAEVGTYSLDAASAGAIVESTARLWDGGVVSVNLAQERGGELVIGNWRTGDIAITRVPYMTEDEETLGLDYRGRTFFVSTRTKGERRLFEVPAGDEAGKFSAEAHACTVDAGMGQVHTLTLSVDTRGRAVGVSYVGVTPQLNGATTSCTLEADRDDADVLWTEAGDETLVDLGPDAGYGGTDRIRISSVDGIYKVAFDVEPSRHCGHSSALARTITLEAGRAACASVVLSD